MEALKKSRAKAKSTITRVETFVNTHENDETLDINEFCARETYLQQAFESYCTVQTQVEDIDEAEEADRNNIEGQYFRVLAKIKSVIQKRSNVNVSNSDRGQQQPAPQTQSDPISRVKLPNLNTPSFSGKYEDWKSFIDLFTALIDDSTQLTNVQKFLYLKGALSNEALNLVNDLPLTNDNYKAALELLKKRYDNNLVIINTHIKGLLGTPLVTRGDGAQLRAFLTCIRQHLNSLRALKLPVDSWDVLLVYLFSQKLDFQSHRAYELEKDNTAVPTLASFLEFLERRCCAFENMSGSDGNRGFKPKQLKSALVTTQGDSTDDSKNKNQRACSFCKKDGHMINKCFKFKGCSLTDKRTFVQQNKLCYNCLGSKHTVSQCQSERCKSCHGKHHSLLHSEEKYARANPSTEIQRESEASSQRDNSAFLGQSHRGSNERAVSSQLNLPNETQINNTSLLSRGCMSQILLATARVHLINRDGNRVEVRALLDSGSQITFISAKILKLLNLDSYSRTLTIGGIGNTASQVNRLVDVILESQYDNTQNFKISCCVLEKITCLLPHTSIDTSKINLPGNITLADPCYHKPSEIDMLISADLYFDLLLPGIIKLGPNLPVLQNTRLGWLVCGSAPANPFINSNSGSNSDVSLFCQNLEDVNEIIPRFWQLEEVTNKHFLSPEDKACEQHFTSTVQRLANGQFQVDLPLRAPDEFRKLGSSLGPAIKRFQFLEKRFQRNNRLFEGYKRFIDEYISLGHGKVIPFNFDNFGLDGTDFRVFLPHHCVIKESSLTTKLRVVFDASSKTSTGLSLNDIMFKGFTVQPELFEILCRFRSFTFVFVADIQKMYRMVVVNPQQRHLQNIIWRDSCQDEFKCIELQTVTYGTNSAPYLATRCLNQLGYDEATKFPLASKAILNQCYVDDILTGANTKTEALELKDQLIKLLASAGFVLHKWSSNDQSLINCAENIKGNEKDILDNTVSSKVLGISWNPSEDVFKISVPDVNCLESFTKRRVLSYIAQMFDPLGLVGPVLVLAKILMQEIWARKVGWDEELPVDLKEKWVALTTNLSCLNSLKIPRNLFVQKPVVEVQYHGYADSSMAAYAACIYIRGIYSDGSVTSNLLCSKSRVAPLKTVSLPRLELCGALLLSRLIHRVVSIMKLNAAKVFLYTDSKIVLCWLGGSPSRWTTFVANRVSEIQELTSNFKWCHTRSENNAADGLSRGILPDDLIGNSYWWNGPKYLLDPNYSVMPVGAIELDSIPEQKKVSFAQTSSGLMPIIDWSRYSNFSRLQRAVAFCLRFINNTRKRAKVLDGSFSVAELNASRLKIIYLIQHESYSKEIGELQAQVAEHETDKSQLVFKDSKIRCLNPIVDSQGLLRVNGRISNAEVSYDQRYPLLLPAKHHVTKLIIRLEHIRLAHAGAHAVLSSLRLRYWPINGLNLVKGVLRSCTVCYRFKAKVSEQLMGNLPLDRVSVARPFLKVGIDYGGPLFIRQSRLKKSPRSKAYIALFVCMATKAIHIELVSSLTTEAFVFTLKRFVARRGNPTTIYSDNATNFKGASNQLNDLYKFFKSEVNKAEIMNFLGTKEIEWRFIPPTSPHWGGLWEAGIKSAKAHLRKVIGDSCMTFEELSTLLAQIEAILNSRPLCPISVDPNDLTCLTPGHFIIGEPLTSFPEVDVSTLTENRLSFWQRCSKMRQTFWTRWSTEYLNRLQNRPKWFRNSKNLDINTVVLVKDENLPPLKWQLARILELLPGKDNKARVARIRTKDGVFVRSITRLCPLPYETS